MSTPSLPSSSEPLAPSTQTPATRRASWWRAALPVLAVGVGVAIFVLLVKTRPKAPRSEHEEPAPLVEVVAAHAATHAVKVEADGTVVPARKVGLVPQVAGRVVWTAPNLQPGGRVKRGEPLVRLEGQDYRLAVEAARAQVAQAELQLRIETRRKELAEHEWERYGQNGSETEQDTALARREPQWETARVALEAARSSLARAKLNLSRTTLTAPFDAVVVENKAEKGQLIGPQSGPVVTLVATDHFWVRVSVPVGSLPHVALPSGEAPGASAVVRQHAGRYVVERRGRVMRLLPDLARGGGMARLLVEIDDPMGEEGEPPMLLGAFVQVRIDARPLEGVFELPRAALREGDRLFLLGKDERLDVRPVRVVWRDEHFVYVDEGLEEGERVITSPLSSPVSGMKLRVARGDAAGEVARREGERSREAVR